MYGKLLQEREQAPKSFRFRGGIALRLGFLFALVTLLLASCTPEPSGGIEQSNPVTLPPQTSPTPSESSLPSFVCNAPMNVPVQKQSSASAEVAITAARLGHSGTYDRFVIEFQGSLVPSFTVTPQPSATFTTDPSGQKVVLQGSSGLKVVVHGAATQPAVDINLTQVGNQDIVLEARRIGEFEDVVSWALGVVPSTFCFRVLTFERPSRLVVDVQRAA